MLRGRAHRVFVFRPAGRVALGSGPRRPPLEGPHDTEEVRRCAIPHWRRFLVRSSPGWGSSTTGVSWPASRGVLGSSLPLGHAGLIEGHTLWIAKLVAQSAFSKVATGG